MRRGEVLECEGGHRGEGRRPGRRQVGITLRCNTSSVAVSGRYNMVGLCINFQSSNEVGAQLQSGLVFRFKTGLMRATALNK